MTVGPRQGGQTNNEPKKEAELQREPGEKIERDEEGSGIR